MTRYGYCTAMAVLFATLANFAVARGDIFRWDNGQLIPGTEGITLGPGVQLDDRDLAFADFNFKDLTGANFSRSNLHGARMTFSKLEDADFSGAIVTEADFGGTTLAGFTKEQLYSTASYQEHDLRGIIFASVPAGQSMAITDLTGWDLSGQNLAGADFSLAVLTNANLSLADTRGATGLKLEGTVSTNLIHPSGWIHEFDLAANERLVAGDRVSIPVQLGREYSISPDAALDLTDNAAIVDSGNASRVRDQIRSGRGGPGLLGTWTGAGITSSAAAAESQTQPGSRSLGYADNGTLPLGPDTAFHGVPVSGSSVLVAYTRTGDANLDGVVNNLDVTVVSAFYAPGLAQPSWALGDFDYNGFVDDDDVTLLSAFYDPSAPPLNSPAAPGVAGGLQSEVAAIPEPSTALLALLLLAIAAAARCVTCSKRLRALLGFIATTMITIPAARGDIFRWDNGQVVPGTQGITPGPGVQLNGRDLKFAQLWHMDLTGANFSRSDLSDARFHSATMTNTDFTGALVEGAMFWGLTSRGFTPEQLYSTASYQAKDLRRMIFFDNDLTDWDFSGQNLDGANFTGARLSGASFSGAVVSGVNFEITEITPEQLHSTTSYQAKDLRGIGLIRLDLAGWNFAGQNLSGASFFDSNVRHVDFTGATVSGANFESSGLTKEQLFSTASYQDKDLHGIGLPKFNLSGWNFSGHDLTQANFYSATLVGADFSKAIVAGANLQNATFNGLTKEQLYSTASYQAKDLRGISFGNFDWFNGGTNDFNGWDFSGQDLTGANLSVVNLANANLTGANLTGARLIWTDLRGANLTNAIVAECVLTSGVFSKEQLYATASYKTGDLHGIGFTNSEFTGWNFAGKNLAGASFSSVKLATTILTDANLTGARLIETSFANCDLTRADARGATGLAISGGTTANLIRPDGLVVNLNLAAGERLVANPNVPIPIKLSANFAIAPAATLDLTNNAAIVDYPGLTAASKVRKQILLGRGGAGSGGKWDGTGITSSTAAAANDAEPDSRSLGYADNLAMPLGTYTSFHGAPVDQSSILIAYTRTGDANLDGVVNDDDVTIVGATYAPGVPNPHWALGDFDYSGFVDDDDVTFLGAFYNPNALPVTSPPAEPWGNLAHEGMSRAVSAVPEPANAMLALLALGTSATAMRVGVRRRQ